ncbi:MAG TPA: hypothetical protein VE944_00935 [Nostoc sp.]|uniref:hypothetical protein n=1 Tax=Nostoc sp. TaxID=1180 RepID=UPI002D3C190E|nr:hypothetical protein [Nostoc sp.]HYX12937.1 hypothetical protein [Nostoc sp.]
MNNSKVATQQNIRIIEGGIKSESNLFFSVPTGNIADFNNSTSFNLDSSLVASTVRSLNFADGTRFSATVFQQNLNNSNIGEVFQNYSKVLEQYGISAQDFLRLQHTLDLNQLQFNEVGVYQQNKKFLQASCIVLRKPCPIDGHPDGCWMDC